MVLFPFQKSCSEKKKKFSMFLDITVQMIQLTIFLVTFSLITHQIVKSEFNSDRSNLQDFVLPAIVSVFVWMISISYLLLSLVLDESRKSSRLIFKDQNLENAKEELKASLRKRLTAMDRASFRARSLQSKAMYEAAAKRKGQTLPPDMNSLRRPYEDLTASFKSTKSNFNEKPPIPEEPNNIELLECRTSSDDDNTANDDTISSEVEVTDDSCWGKTKQIYHFLLETTEYKHPDIYGWRIKFRRLFMTIGVICFTYQTISTAIDTQNYSSKAEIQDILDYLGTNLTWPDSGSILDDVFQLYNSMVRIKSYLMMTATLLFWVGLLLDLTSQRTTKYRTLLYSASRMANFFGSLIGKTLFLPRICADIIS